RQPRPLAAGPSGPGPPPPAGRRGAPTRPASCPATARRPVVARGTALPPSRVAAAAPASPMLVRPHWSPEPAALAPAAPPAAQATATPAMPPTAAAVVMLAPTSAARVASQTFYAALPLPMPQQPPAQPSPRGPPRQWQEIALSPSQSAGHRAVGSITLWSPLPEQRGEEQPGGRHPGAQAEAEPTAPPRPLLRRPGQARGAGVEAYSICSSGSEGAGEPPPTAMELGLEAAASASFSPRGYEGPPDCSPKRHTAPPAVQHAAAKARQACGRRARAAGSGRLGGRAWSAHQDRPVPPSSASWDWPLSRGEKKARVDMIDRSMLRADCRALAGKLRRSLGTDRAAL
ncbi:unnamed protein product, partial [Prorocentrum cordatum]